MWGLWLRLHDRCCAKDHLTADSAIMLSLRSSCLARGSLILRHSIRRRRETELGDLPWVHVCISPKVAGDPKWGKASTRNPAYLDKAFRRGQLIDEHARKAPGVGNRPDESETRFELEHRLGTTRC